MTAAQNKNVNALVAAYGSLAFSRTMTQYGKWSHCKKLQKIVE